MGFWPAALAEIELRLPERAGDRGSMVDLVIDASRKKRGQEKASPGCLSWAVVFAARGVGAFGVAAGTGMIVAAGVAKHFAASHEFRKPQPESMQGRHVRCSHVSAPGTWGLRRAEGALWRPAKAGPQRRACNRGLQPRQTIDTPCILRPPVRGWSAIPCRLAPPIYTIQLSAVSCHRSSAN